MSRSGTWLGWALCGWAAVALGGAVLAGCERTISDDGFDLDGGNPEPTAEPTAPPVPTEIPGS